jgi:hypothetical protein
VVVGLIYAGLAVSLVLGAALALAGRHRWFGLSVGPVVGITLIAVAQKLSNAPLNPKGGDLSHRSVTTLVGCAVIVLYLAGYAAGAGARWARAHLR